MVHSASLVHDDIIDGDTVRRGKPSAWLKYGISKALLVPHLLVSHAQIIIERYGMLALKLTIRTWKNVTLGEYKDVIRGSYYDKSAYPEIALRKTGALFGVAAALGAIAAKREDLIDKARMYGESLGFAFQVADDLVDLHMFLQGELDLRRSPSLNSFLAWVMDGEPYMSFRGDEVMYRALTKLVNIIDHAEKCAIELSKYMKVKELSIIINNLPRYAVKRMLVEGGLSSIINRL